MTAYKKVTLKDIADATGVSISAVSMILNQRHDVSFTDETVKKVFDTAHNLGYKLKSKESSKSLSNSNFQGSSKNIIAVFCPNIYNPYYSMIAQSIESAAYKNHYKTIIMTTFRDKQHEKEMIQDVLHMNVKGIIFTMIPNNIEYVEKISKKFPIVIIGDKTSSSNIDVIETNNYTAGMLLAEHLYELGHRHVAFLTTTINSDISLAMRFQRYKGVESIFKKNLVGDDYDIILKEQKISPDYERNNLSLEYEVGYNLCQECLKDKHYQKVTAFIGNNDMVAYGIVDALLKNGYSIPTDYSVCGFDNDFPSRLLPISLTSIEHFMEDKGKKSLETLIQKIQHDETQSEESPYIIRIEYKPSLIIRDSTNRARNR